MSAPNSSELLAERIAEIEARRGSNDKKHAILSAAAIAIPCVLLTAAKGNRRCVEAAHKMAPFLAKLTDKLTCSAPSGGAIESGK